jgi:hypothetical protein
MCKRFLLIVLLVWNASAASCLDELDELEIELEPKVVKSTASNVTATVLPPGTIRTWFTSLVRTCRFSILLAIADRHIWVPATHVILARRRDVSLEVAYTLWRSQEYFRVLYPLFVHENRHDAAIYAMDACFIMLSILLLLCESLWGLLRYSVWRLHSWVDDAYVRNRFDVWRYTFVVICKSVGLGLVVLRSNSGLWLVCASAHLAFVLTKMFICEA